MRTSPVELLKLWRGLFYCMWMADKPLVQEDLARKLAGLTGCFREHSHGLENLKKK